MASLLAQSVLVRPAVARRAVKARAAAARASVFAGRAAGLAARPAGAWPATRAGRGAEAPRRRLCCRRGHAQRQLDSKPLAESLHAGRPRPRRTRGARWRGSAGSWRPGARRRRPFRSRSALTAARRFDTASRDAGRRAAAPLAARAEGAPRRLTRPATRWREHAPPGSLYAAQRRTPVLTSGPAGLTLRHACRAQTRALTCLRF